MVVSCSGRGHFDGLMGHPPKLSGKFLYALIHLENPFFGEEEGTERGHQKVEFFL